MKTKSAFLIAIAVTICAASGFLVFKHFAPGESASQPNARIVHDIAPKAAPFVVKPRVLPPAETTNAGMPGSNDAPLKLQSQPSPNAAVAAKEPLKDPIAREALALVGFDPEAEAYWFDAINDMSLPPNERQDLIEDLNEEGLPDPKHPTIDDLPLILSRLELIETIGPDAADEVNADAFREAYKDLLNLAELAMGGGEPVK